MLSLLLIAAVALLVAPAFAQAPGKGYGVETRAISAPIQHASPGQIISLSFRVTHTGGAADDEEEFLEALELPEGWQSLLPAASFTLGPGQGATRLALLRVPTTVAAGEHTIAYTVRSQRDYAIQDAATLTVVVAAVSKLSLLLESKPDMVIGGESYTITARAINGGNASLPVKVAASGSKGDTIGVEPAQFDLPAGANQLITVTAKTANVQERPGQRSLVLTATAPVSCRAAPAEGQPISARLSVAVNVIARVTTAPDLTHRIPATLTFLFSGEGTEAGFQAELRGRGTLDDRGERHLDFLLRGPNAQDSGIFGWRDEYRLNYSSPQFDAQLGDQSYSLSRLTSYFRYGRGVGVTLHPGEKGISAGAHFVRSRWGRETQEIALYAHHRIADDLGLKLNFLHSSADDSGLQSGASDTLISLEGSYTPHPALRADFEYARGSHEPDEGKRASDDAYRVEIRGKVGRDARYSLQKTRAGADYFGYYRDADYTTASVSSPLGSRLRARAAYRAWDQNLELRSYQNTAPRERLVSAGLSYSLPYSWYAELDVERFSRRDALAPVDYDYTESPLRLSIGRSTTSHSMRLEMIHKRRTDWLTNTEITAQEYRASAYFRPSDAYTFSIYGALSSTDAPADSFLLGGHNNLGMSFHWAPQDRLTAGMSYYRYGFGERGSNRQWEVYGRYLFADTRSLNLRIRAIEGRPDGQGTSWQLTYAIPLGLPASAKTTVGGLRGRVFDDESATRAGCADVILICGGATAITDDQGQFIFPALPVGTHTLDIDRGSLSADQTAPQGRMTTERLPLTVEIVGGKMATLEIATTRGSSISGVVRLAPKRAADETTDEQGQYLVGDRSPTGAPPSDGGDEQRVEATGVGSLLVEASGPDELMRVMTNARGEFAFRGLRPGTWRVRVYPDGLPEHHALEQSELPVELAAGEAAQVSFEVRPRVRPIRLIDGGALDVSGD